MRFIKKLIPVLALVLATGCFNGNNNDSSSVGTTSQLTTSNGGGQASTSAPVAPAITDWDVLDTGINEFLEFWGIDLPVMPIPSNEVSSASVDIETGGVMVSFSKGSRDFVINYVNILNNADNIVYYSGVESPLSVTFVSEITDIAVTEGDFCWMQIDVNLTGSTVDLTLIPYSAFAPKPTWDSVEPSYPLESFVNRVLGVSVPAPFAGAFYNYGIDGRDHMLMFVFELPADISIGDAQYFYDMVLTLAGFEYIGPGQSYGYDYVYVDENNVGVYMNVDYDATTYNKLWLEMISVSVYEDSEGPYLDYSPRHTMESANIDGITATLIETYTLIDPALLPSVLPVSNFYDFYPNNSADVGFPDVSASGVSVCLEDYFGLTEAADMEVHLTNFIDALDENWEVKFDLPLGAAFQTYPVPVAALRVLDGDMEGYTLVIAVTIWNFSDGSGYILSCDIFVAESALLA